MTFHKLCVSFSSSVFASFAGSSGQLTGSCMDRLCITVEKEITAEAGLCVIIPCSSPLHRRLGSILWFKCESKQECDKPVKIFSQDNNGVQDGFKGRVSLLEPNIVERDCSIIINDLTESDSGSYELRLARFPFRLELEPSLSLRSTVSVKGMKTVNTLTVMNDMMGETSPCPDVDAGTTILHRWCQSVQESSQILFL